MRRLHQRFPAPRLPLLLLLFLTAGCSSYEYPEIGQSQKKIDRLTEDIGRTDNVLSKFAEALPKGHELIFRLRQQALNRSLAALLRQRSDDVRIDFLRTENVWVEQASLLGIRYSNRMHIDTGHVILNLEQLRFQTTGGNEIGAALRIAGRGNLRVSGRHTGIPFSARPDLVLGLSDSIRFKLSPGSGGGILLTPLSKALKLRIRLEVSMLGWKIPYEQEVAFNIKDLIQPMLLPPVVRSAITLPAFGHQGAEKGNDITLGISFTDPEVIARDGAVELRSDVRIISHTR